MMTSVAKSKHIYEISAEQRTALLSPRHDLCCDDLKLNEILQAIKHTYNGLLDEDTKERLITAGQELNDDVTHRPIGNVFNSLEFGSAFNTEKMIFREVALDSAISAMFARLLLDVEEERSDKIHKRTDETSSPITLRLHSKMPSWQRARRSLIAAGTLITVRSGQLIVHL